MKTTFSVNTDNINEFAGLLAENEISNEIKGTDNEDNILVEVTHSKNDREAIEMLEELAEDE